MEEFNHWQAVFETIDNNVKKLVGTTAGKVKSNAYQRAPKDTGFMAESIYVVTEDGAESQSAAATRPGQELFPELPATPHNEADVAVGATYGVFPELGTSKQAAQPYLTPAVEDERQPFLDALSNLEELAK